MSKKRILFSKTGRAQYISHLDLLRTFQRIFRRAGIELRHSEGFNPHPYLTFALPLSVAAESVCELLDTELLEDVPDDALASRLNAAAPEGIRILQSYTSSRKFADLKWLEVEGRLCYDSGADGKAEALTTLFNYPALVIVKKTKKGTGDFDVIQALKSIRFEQSGPTEVILRAVISAQAPTLNPDHLITAVRTHQPSLTPDFAAFKRLEAYDPEMRIFR